jgi:hypothetical protein
MWDELRADNVTASTDCSPNVDLQLSQICSFQLTRQVYHRSCDGGRDRMFSSCSNA